MAYRIPNWDKFQHYNKRRPPWIKLYRDLLDKPEWFQLTGDQVKTLVNLWLIASENDRGYLPDSDVLAFRLRCDSATIENHCNALVSLGFMDVDSDTLAGCYQHATPETEREAEGEGERESDICSTPDGVSPATLTPYLFTVKDGKVWQMPTSLYEKLLDAFGNIDIDAEMRKAVAWCEANPGKRKTAKGMPRFLNAWLSRVDPVMTPEDEQTKLLREMGLLNEA